MSDARKAAKEAYLASLATQKSAITPPVDQSSSSSSYQPPTFPVNTDNDRPGTERDRIFEERRRAFLQKQQQSGPSHPTIDVNAPTTVDPRSLPSALKFSPTRVATANGQRPGSNSPSPKKRVHFPSYEETNQVRNGGSFEDKPSDAPSKQQQPSGEINLNAWKREGYPSEFAYAKAMGVLDGPQKPKRSSVVSDPTSNGFQPPSIYQPSPPQRPQSSYQQSSYQPLPEQQQSSMYQQQNAVMQQQQQQQRFESPPRRGQQGSSGDTAGRGQYNDGGGQATYVPPVVPAAVSKREKQAEFAQQLLEDQHARMQQHQNSNNNYNSPPRRSSFNTDGGNALKGLGEKTVRDASPERRHQQQQEFARQLAEDQQARQRLKAVDDHRSSSSSNSSSSSSYGGDSRDVSTDNGGGGLPGLGQGNQSNAVKKERQAEYARERKQQQDYRQRESDQQKEADNRNQNQQQHNQWGGQGQGLGQYNQGNSGPSGTNRELQYGADNRNNNGGMRTNDPWASSSTQSSQSPPRPVTSGINALGLDPLDAKAAKKARQAEYSQSLLNQQQVKQQQQSMEGYLQGPGPGRPDGRSTGMRLDAPPSSSSSSSGYYQPSLAPSQSQADVDRDAKRAKQMDYARALQDQQMWQQQHGTNDRAIGGSSPSRRDFHQGFNHMSPPKGGGQGGVLDEGWVMGPLGLPVRRTLQVGNRGVQKAFNQGAGVGSPSGHSAPSTAMPFAQQLPPGMMMQAPYSAPQMQIQQPPLYGGNYNATGAASSSSMYPTTQQQQPSMDNPAYPPYVDNTAGGVYRQQQLLGGGQMNPMGVGVDGAYPYNNSNLIQHPAAAAAMMAGGRRDPRTAIDGTDVMDERKQMQLLMKADQARALEEQIRNNALRAAAEKAKREADEIEETRRLEVERKAIADAFEKEKHEAKQRAEEANQAALSRQMEEKRRQKEDEIRLEQERTEKENERIRKEQELLRQRELEEIQREAAGHRKPSYSSPPASVMKRGSMQGRNAVDNHHGAEMSGRGDLFGPASPSPSAKGSSLPPQRPPPHHRDQLFDGGDSSKGSNITNNNNMERQRQQRPESSTPASLRQIKQEAHHAAEVAEEARRQVERLRQDLLDGVGSSNGAGAAGARLLQRGAGRDPTSSSLSSSRNFDNREMLPRTVTSVDDSYEEVYRLDRTLNSDSCFVFPDGSSYRISSGGGGDDGSQSHPRMRRSTSAGGGSSGGRRRPRLGETAPAGFGATLPLGLGGPCLDLRGVGTPSVDAEANSIDRLSTSMTTSPHRNIPVSSFLDLRGLQHKAHPSAAAVSSSPIAVKSIRSPTKSSSSPSNQETTTEATAEVTATTGGATKSSRPSSHRDKPAASVRDIGNGEDTSPRTVSIKATVPAASGRGDSSSRVVDPITANAVAVTATSSSRPGSSGSSRVSSRPVATDINSPEQPTYVFVDSTRPGSGTNPAASARQVQPLSASSSLSPLKGGLSSKKDGGSRRSAPAKDDIEPPPQQQPMDLLKTQPSNRRTSFGTASAAVSSGEALTSARSSPRVPTPTADQVKEELNVLLRNLKLMASGNGHGFTNNNTNNNNVPGAGSTMAAMTAMEYSRPSTPGSTAGSSMPGTARSARTRIPGESTWLSLTPDAEDLFRQQHHQPQQQHQQYQQQYNQQYQQQHTSVQGGLRGVGQGTTTTTNGRLMDSLSLLRNSGNGIMMNTNGAKTMHASPVNGLGTGSRLAMRGQALVGSNMGGQSHSNSRFMNENGRSRASGGREEHDDYDDYSAYGL